MPHVTVRRRIAALGIAALLGVPALGTGIDAVQARSADAVTICDRLDGRVAEVPSIRARIRDQIQAIERRLERIVDPRRRVRVAARLEPRLAGLRALDARLAQQRADVQRRCAPPT